MKHVLILYDDILENSEFFNLVRKVFGPAKAKALTDFDNNFKNYSNIIILITPRMKEEVWIQFSDAIREERKLPSAILFSVSDEEKENAIFMGRISNYLDGCITFQEAISCYRDETDIKKKELLAMKLVEIKRKYVDSGDMPLDLLEKQLTSIITSHNTCSLSTCIDGKIRSTPIEYSYINGIFYFLSEGGEKFANLYANPNVGIAIYKEFNGFANLEGMEIEGTAHMVALFSEEYKKAASKRGLLPDNLKKLPVPLHMFKVIPQRIEVLSSAFEKKGYKAKQIYEPHNYAHN